MQEIELNKAQWRTLFEPYLFFEADKNYLQIDIIAADADDLLAWKGWVESRLRQLILKARICLHCFWLCFILRFFKIMFSRLFKYGYSVLLCITM